MSRPTVARAVSQKPGEKPEAGVIARNQPGACATIEIDIAAKAFSQEKTLVFGPIGPRAMPPDFGSRLPSNAVNDVTAISHLGNAKQ